MQTMIASHIGSGNLDKLIQGFQSAHDDDLMICESHGVAYQSDMSAGRAPYDAGYLAKVDSYDGSPIACNVNAGRCALMMRHMHDGATVLDVGAGSGAFVRDAKSWGFNAKGFDIIPQAVERLRASDDYADDARGFDAVTMWDSLEHMEDPGTALEIVQTGALLFVSIPTFNDLSMIRASKHYRPGEHLYYWTESGFINWMAMHGFRLLESSDHEIKAGRESIGAFAFCRDVSR